MSLLANMPQFSSDQMIGLFAMTGAFAVGLVGIVVGCLTNLYKVRAQEQTKREIAAYVAEGSISPEDARRILAAGGSIGEQIKERIREAIRC